MKKVQKAKATVATKIKAKNGVQSTESYIGKCSDNLIVESTKDPVVDGATDTGGQRTESPSKDITPSPDNTPPKKPSKQIILIQLLQRSEGATVAELMEATNWQKHSIQGTMSGVLKKKLGFAIVSDKEGERGRVYRITAAQEAA